MDKSKSQAGGDETIYRLTQVSALRGSLKMMSEPVFSKPHWQRLPIIHPSPLTLHPLVSSQIE